MRVIKPVGDAEERIPPNPKLLVEALRSIGYSLSAAVADIVDNSISAGSANILIRLETGAEAVERIFIADDGEGMLPEDLREAMRFGSAMPRALESLSKYGMGLKLASLSQATAMTVATRKQGKTSGRRWTVESISDNWRCDTISESEAAALLRGPWEELDCSKSGTVIEWTGLDRIQLPKGGEDRAVGKIIKGLQFHLGLHFHRFIEDERVAVWVDRRQVGQDGLTMPASRVLSLNPFQYGSGAPKDYPQGFALDLGEAGEVMLEAHIWPPGSKDRQYKLDDANKRQGFYFYRNDRLIQAGGWNGLRTTEPHLSLARVRVELPARLDSQFSLDVKKSSVRSPPVFLGALRDAVSGGQSKFPDFLKKAQTTYRRKEALNPNNYPLVPKEGLPKALQESLEELLAPRDSRIRSVRLEWAELEGGDLFELDRENQAILLNRAYRRRVLGGRKASVVDAPLMKTLLFLLVEKHLESGRVSSVQREALDKWNRVLVQAIKALPKDGAE